MILRDGEEGAQGLGGLETQFGLLPSPSFNIAHGGGAGAGSRETWLPGS